MNVTRLKPQPPVAPHPRLVVKPDAPDSNLSVLLRSNSAAHSPSAYEILALRLSFSGNLGRTAGQGFEASRLLAQAWDGRGKARAELDDIFAAEEELIGIERESEMSSRLCAIGFKFRN